MRLLLAFIVLVVGINADREVIVIPREQPLAGEQPDYRQQQHLQINNVGPVPKAIVISGGDGEPVGDSQPLMNAVLMNAIRNQMNRRDANGTDIPEVVIADPEQQPQVVQQLQRGSGEQEVVEKVYKLPAMTRMISSEEQTDAKDYQPSRKHQLWRSPIPFLHEGCPMHNQMQHQIHKHKKSAKGLRRRGRRQHKTTITTTTTTAPVVDIHNEVQRPQLPPPLRSLLASILMSRLSGRPEPDSETPEPAFNPIGAGMPARGAIIMSISRPHSDSSPMLPFLAPKPAADMFSPIPRIPLLMAIIRKRLMEASAPGEESPQLPALPDVQPIRPFNPFLALLAKIRNRIAEKSQELSPKEFTNANKDKKFSFNFNVNLTINNNYGDREARVVRKPFSFPLFASL